MLTNVLHLKYAVEVADAGSINRAAENLYVSQPNLSRAIRELESNLGISIFARSAKGMVATPEGEEFLASAREILTQLDTLNERYARGAQIARKFSISVPRASYVSEAFARFSTKLGPGAAELFYKETNAWRAIDNLLNEGYRLAIIRYAEAYESYFQSLLASRELHYEPVTEFRYCLIMHKDSPLAALEEIQLSDLEGLIEVAHSDHYVPLLTSAEVRKTELTQNVNRHIYVFERAGQFDLLNQNHETFMWVSHLPESLLKRYDLVERYCSGNQRLYRDVLVYRRNYRLTELDRAFMEELRECLKQYEA